MVVKIPEKILKNFGKINGRHSSIGLFCIVYYEKIILHTTLHIIGEIRLTIFGNYILVVQLV